MGNSSKALKNNALLTFSDFLLKNVSSKIQYKFIYCNYNKILNMFS